jgi:two-component system cell cycle sensor histidine kinase/response regulator CckA
LDFTTRKIFVTYTTTDEIFWISKLLSQSITEHKESEEQIREQVAFLDKLCKVVTVQDLEHRIIYWNKCAEQLYGWKPEEAIGRNVNELLSKDKSPQPMDAKKSISEKGEWSGELHHVTKDGREVIVESRWTLVHDNKGKPKSILVINTNITGKKKLEEQFLRAQRMESIGTLAIGIAHDINNVLTPIMLSQELLRERLTDEESKRLLNTIERSTHRGANLMKQVLSFTKGIEGERNALQVANLISEIRQIAKETFPRNIEIRTDIPKDIWTISGDATQIHQVLMNLCVNARDAMPDGGILSISAKNIFIDENFTHINIEARVGRYIVIAVTDNGTGIPPKIMDMIFEPFFTTKEHGKGTGLGLSTALGIVKNHSGFINVYSEVGKGTTFQVYLPAITTTKIQKVEEPMRELVIGYGELILVVDDEDQIRDITSSALKTNGYRVLTASNGLEAIALYEQNREEIKLVLMDMMMPVMDGLAGIQELRKINPELKIIAASGLTEKDKLTKVAGTMNAFLLKPFTVEKLLRTIHEVLSAK